MTDPASGGRRAARVVVGSLFAFALAFAMVVFGAALTRASASGTPAQVTTALRGVDAPSPDQLAGWTYQLAGHGLALGEWEALAEESLSVRAAVNDGDVSWVDTVVDLESLFFEVDDRLACAARYGREIQWSCGVRYDLGIQRETSTQGRVVFVRGTPLPSEDADPKEVAGCELFLKCMTYSKLGGAVAIPQNDSRAMVVYQLVGLLPMSDDLKPPENLRAQAKMSDDYKRELEQQIAAGAKEHSAYLEAKMRSLEDKARYLRRRAHEFENGT